MIILTGRIYKHDTNWLIEIPLVDAMTQADTREEAFVMLKDYIETDMEAVIDYQVIDDGSKSFELGFQTSSGIVPWVIKRAREKAGLSLDQAAKALGANSKNAFARYEKKDGTIPSIAKLSELLSVVGGKVTLSCENRD